AKCDRASTAVETSHCGLHEGSVRRARAARALRAMECDLYIRLRRRMTRGLRFTHVESASRSKKQHEGTAWVRLGESFSSRQLQQRWQDSLVHRVRSRYDSRTASLHSATSDAESKAKQLAMCASMPCDGTACRRRRAFSIARRRDGLSADSLERAL